MPYFRITIFLRTRKPSTGIRYYGNTNIDAVTNIVRAKAIKYYGHEVLDIEVAMLSNKSSAVKKLQQKQMKAREDKLFPDSIKDVKVVRGRKDGHGLMPTLEQRKEKKD